MTPERQAIIDAIKQGFTTPREIGKNLGKKAQQISKLLYKMRKQGLVERHPGGRYTVDISLSIGDKCRLLGRQKGDKSTISGRDISEPVQNLR